MRKIFKQLIFLAIASDVIITLLCEVFAFELFKLLAIGNMIILVCGMVAFALLILYEIIVNS